MNPSLSFLHHTNYLLNPGGMQRMIRLHLDADPRQQAVAIRDAAEGDIPPQVHLLGATPGTAIRQIRDRYAVAIDDRTVGTSVYHNLWGRELVHPCDQARFKAGMLHSDFPRFPQMVRRLAGMFDVLVNINPALHEQVVRVLPGWPAERLVLLDSPVHFPPAAAMLRSSPRPACRIGISGRIKREQKRLDRLPSFLDACDRLLPDYHLDILGTGDFEDELRRLLSGRSNVSFHGWLEGPAYWEMLSRWRYILFLSDYEGTPLSMLEAAGAGAVPIYPDFHPGQALPSGVLLPQVYPVGDVQGAARVLKNLESRFDLYRGEWLEATEGLLTRHAEASYLKRFTEALHWDHLSSLPPKPPVGPVGKLPGWLPLMAYHTMVKRLRFGWGGVLRHN